LDFMFFFRRFSSARSFPPLISSQELISVYRGGKQAKNIWTIDASWHLGGQRNADLEFLQARIIGAQRFNIDKIADVSIPLPHMLPKQEQFENAISEMGINRNDTVVVYATPGALGAARCWWTFKCFGHEDVRLLDGDLDSYIEAGGEVDRSENVIKPPRSSYRATFNPDMVKNWQQVLQVSQNESISEPLIIDARSEARFYAKVAEARPGVASGHIPHSINIPFTSVLENGNPSKYKTTEELQRVFKDAGIDVQSPRPIITSCGSGVTACILTFALHLLGRDPVLSPVYDGSWTEWGSRKDLPIEK